MFDIKEKIFSIQFLSINVDNLVERFSHLIIYIYTIFFRHIYAIINHHFTSPIGELNFKKYNEYWEIKYNKKKEC